MAKPNNRCDATATLPIIPNDPAAADRTAVYPALSLSSPDNSLYGQAAEHSHALKAADRTLRLPVLKSRLTLAELDRELELVSGSTRQVHPGDVTRQMPLAKVIGRGLPMIHSTGKPA